MQNQEHSRAGGAEFEQAVAYQVDMWSDSPVENWELQDKVNDAMAELGFRRTFSGDLYEVESHIHHRTSRYEAVVSVDDATIHQ